MRTLRHQQNEETERLLGEKRKLKAGLELIAPSQNAEKDEQQLCLLTASIDKYYGEGQRLTIADSFRKYRLVSDSAGLPAVCYTTYRKEILKSMTRVARHKEELPTGPNNQKSRDATEPGEVVYLSSMVLGSREEHKHLLLVAIDGYTREAVVRVTTEKPPAKIIYSLGNVAIELPYSTQRVVIDRSFDANAGGPHSAAFDILETFLNQLQSCLNNLPTSLDSESLELVLNRVVSAYNHEAPQTKLDGMSPVEFRKRFLGKKRPTSERNTSDSLNGTQA
jgi:hypothetical protein